MPQSKPVEPGYDRHRRRFIAGFLAIAASGCADATAIQANQPIIATSRPPAGQVFVMEPLWRTNESGNIGRDFRVINSEVSARILVIVSERFSGAEMVEAGPRDARRVLPGYPLTVDGEGVTTEELNAACEAYEHGAAFLLVATITEWKEMRTDDPIGAFILAHNSVAIALRLMRLREPALSGRATFKNRARLTLNQPADHLLNGRFRDVVLHLVSGST
jgi:hypothetical protein